MKNFFRGAVAAAWLLIAAACPAFAQSSPNLTKGQVLTAGQWNALFAAKQDYLGFVPLNVAGGVMTGRLVTAPPGAATAGLNLSPGTTPANPANGDMWATGAGLFVRINGVTIGPLSGGTTSSFAATAPLAVTFPGNIVTYGLNTDSTLTVLNGNLGINLPNPNTWRGLQTFSAGVSIASAFSAPGLVKNSDLVSASTTVNGQACTLGSACTINASATSITLGITSIAGGGVSTRVLFDAAGVLGEYGISGSGSVAMTNSPTLVTPTLGAAVGTSLALNGCSLGANFLCVQGGAAVTTAAALALTVGLNSGTTPVFQVDASTAAQVAGLKVTGAATGGTVALSAIDSGANTNLLIQSKGAGSITLSAPSGSATTVNIGQANLSGATLNIAGFTSGSTSIIASAAASGQLTLPAATDTLVARSTIETLSNKTLASPTVTGAFNATGLVTFADMAAAAVASASQYLGGAANVLVPASVIYQAETTTTFGATTTFDFSTFISTAVTLTSNITTMTLANVKAGQAGTIAFIQDATGGRIAVFNSIFKFAGGATPTLSTAPNAVDVLSYSCRSATFCVASLLQNVR